MHLKADSIDGHALALQVAHEIVDAVRFGVQLLTTVVVVEQQGLRVGFMRQTEGLGNVPVAKLLPEHRIAQPAAIVGDRFVDNVPGEDLTAIVCGDGCGCAGRTLPGGRRPTAARPSRVWRLCQMSACPFRRMPRAAAYPAIASPPAKFSTPWICSIGSHFISYSAVR